MHGNLQLEKFIDKGIPASIKADGLKLKFILQQFVAFLTNITESGKISVSVSSPGSKQITVSYHQQRAYGATAKSAQIFFG